LTAFVGYTLTAVASVGVVFVYVCILRQAWRDTKAHAAMDARMRGFRDRWGSALYPPPSRRDVPVRSGRHRKSRAVDAAVSSDVPARGTASVPHGSAWDVFDVSQMLLRGDTGLVPPVRDEVGR
jgi:hypothetical protein